jgi:hypothetical protein
LKEIVDKTVSWQLLIFEMARISTKAKNHVVEHIHKLHINRQRLKKCINQKSAKNLINQPTYKTALIIYFDILTRKAAAESYTAKVQSEAVVSKTQRARGRRQLGLIHHKFCKKGKY